MANYKFTIVYGGSTINSSIAGITGYTSAGTTGGYTNMGGFDQPYSGGVNTGYYVKGVPIQYGGNYASGTSSGTSYYNF